MEIGMSIRLGRHPAMDVSDVLILGQAVEVTFYKRRRGIIVPMPDKGALSRQQFQEIVELIAKEGQIDLEIVSSDDVHINTDPFGVDMIRLEEMGVTEPQVSGPTDERINQQVHQVYQAEIKKQMDLLEVTEG